MSVNTDVDGRSPLHYAADYGQTEVLQYLVSKGANTNAKDKHGISVLLAAIWEGHTNCVKFLLQKVCAKQCFCHKYDTLYQCILTPL